MAASFSGHLTSRVRFPAGTLRCTLGDRASLPWLRSQKLSDAHQMLGTVNSDQRIVARPGTETSHRPFASCTPATSSVPELDLVIHKPSSSPTPPSPPRVACRHIQQGPTQTSHSFSDTARFPDLQQDRGDITVRHCVQLFRREHTENTARPLLWPFFFFCSPIAAPRRATSRAAQVCATATPAHLL